MNNIVGKEVPEKFITSLDDARIKRNALDTTLKVAMDYHRDTMMILSEESDLIWNKIYDHFGLDTVIKRSQYYAIKQEGKWRMAERPIGHPYRIEENKE